MISPCRGYRSQRSTSIHCGDNRRVPCCSCTGSPSKARGKVSQVGAAAEYATSPSFSETEAGRAAVFSDTSAAAANRNIGAEGRMPSLSMARGASVADRGAPRRSPGWIRRGRESGSARRPESEERGESREAARGAPVTDPVPCVSPRYPDPEPPQGDHASCHEIGLPRGTASIPLQRQRDRHGQTAPPPRRSSCSASIGTCAGIYAPALAATRHPPPTSHLPKMRVTRRPGWWTASTSTSPPEDFPEQYKDAVIPRRSSAR